jgi:hypothetical protein
MKHGLRLALALIASSTFSSAQNVMLETDPSQSNWTWSVYAPPPLNVWAVPNTTDQFQFDGRVGGPFQVNSSGHAYAGQFTEGQCLWIPDMEGYIPGFLGIHVVDFHFRDLVIRKMSSALEFGPEATSDGTYSGDQWFYFVSGTAEGQILGGGTFNESLADLTSPPVWQNGAFTTLADGRLHFESFESLYFQVTESGSGYSFDISFSGDFFADEVTDITTFCFGDGSGATCPCGNTGGVGGGCMNTTGLGGKLRSSGSSSVSSDDLVLLGQQLVPSQPGLYFQGNNAINGGNGNPFGDGLRCAGGGVVRMQVRFADAQGASATSVSLATVGGIAPGDVKRYQCWYRNPPAGFCGGYTFNLSNGVQVNWSP